MNPLFFELFVLGENPFFLNSLFKGFLFELPFLGRTLCFLNSLFFWGWFDEKSFLAFLMID
ncbi:hypothetical protein HPNQ4099_1155 [Helicobacter pylori NQ4099]|uniref:Uncharacterized protein n=1 Tax=Helicobacter pylori NQ4099 TaxID=992026 RepID=J0ITP4_HELPX|nr:hypothetical protein HPNQ4099_1155 [Helicobacter pylori NQ4099]